VLRKVGRKQLAGVPAWDHSSVRGRLRRPVRCPVPAAAAVTGTM